MPRRSIGELSLKDAYKIYKEEALKPLPWKEYRDICHATNKEFAAMIVAGKDMKLPLLGYIGIRKSKENLERKNYDYGHYNKTGEKRMIINNHSDGFLGKWWWNKSRCMLSGKFPYSFTATRDLKREIAAIFKEPKGHTRYPESIYTQKWLRKLQHSKQSSETL